HRSLVEALDEVSQRLHSGASAGNLSMFPPVSRLPSGLRGDEPPGGGARSLAAGPSESGQSAPFPPSFRRASRARLHLLWSRFSGRGPAPALPAGSTLEGRDFDQPARQFLREA